MLTIHLHASPEAAFYVNSFILEGEKSLVIVDTQFLVSSAAAFAAMIASLHKAGCGHHHHPSASRSLQRPAADRSPCARRADLCDRGHHSRHHRDPGRQTPDLASGPWR